MFASCLLFCYACACIASDEQAFKHFWQSASLHNRCYCFHFSGKQKQTRSKRGTPDTRNGGRCRKNNTCPHHCLFDCSIPPSFFPRTITEWNKLPEESVSSQSLCIFKSKLIYFSFYQ